MTEPIIRDAQTADLDAAATIMEHYVLSTLATFTHRAPTAADWQVRMERMREDGLPFLVAELHPEAESADEAPGEIVGFAYADWWRPKSEHRITVEDSIYLSPAAAGRGVGTALLSALIERCAEAGHQQMIGVLTDEESEASFALHTKLGFRPVGHLPQVDVKHGRTLGTYLLQRPLR
ncbi:GNAT family N-acetyltransferase [Nesterenkonia sp. NBAIMH1]|uniref:GNAT family N-acetyltransferase n=1 Tax=Nesterenkonia sp. NBAIMH1 TaxID=2600320 RepID=UPI001AEFD54D|nr:GNAT family N-acetyltransferase [Nesterenkonia sp. NBAIMH1]